jgi:hypothetical protein
VDENVPQTLLADLAFGRGADVFIGEPVTSCLGGFVGGLKAVIHDATRGDDRTGELLLDASVNELEGRVNELAYQIDRLREETGGECPNANDTFALGSAYARARSTVADEGMRIALANSIVNAFEPSIYRRGCTLRLYGVIERLTFEDIGYLTRLHAGDEGLRDYRALPEGSHDRGHADCLLAERLVYVRQVPTGRPSPTVDGEGLFPTDMGELMLELLSARPPGIPADWTPPWARDMQLLDLEVNDDSPRREP